MGDLSGTKDWVEGYANEGKPIDRIMNTSKLEEIQGKVVKAQGEINKKLQDEGAKLASTQTRLNDCNDEFIALSKRVDDAVERQQVSLNADSKSQLNMLTRDTIDNFLTRRPKEDLDASLSTEVDVRYEPGVETTGSNLHIGGEGAGSRDAKFTVLLQARVETLAKDAAKYWGLDADKVFFLDRDGRIVPDNMKLSDIILPPRGEGGDAAASSAPVGNPNAGTLAVNTGTEIAVREKDDGYIVKGRNYSLTLVRATTVLDKEDLNLPKGERWNDFTFNANQLNQELEATRKKRAGAEMDGSALSIDSIPSLHNLILRGQEKKKRKRADTNCRIAEFLVFLTSLILYYYFILCPDEDVAWRALSAMQGIEGHLINFTTNEQETLGADSYLDIHNEKQYEAWLKGPLQRCVIGRALSEDNMFVLGTVGYSYPPVPGKEPDLDWVGCSEDLLPPCDTGNNSSNVSNNASNNSSDCLQAALLDLNDTNGTAVATVDLAAHRRRGTTNGVYTQPSAFPCDLKSCLNERVVEIYTQARADGMETPVCELFHGRNPMVVLFDSLTSHPFSFATGQMSSYSGGEQTWINSSDWDASIDQFITASNGTAHPAHAVVIFVYSPTLNTFFVAQMILEHSLSGTYITTRKFTVLHLEAVDEAQMACLLLVILLTILCLLMEVRRIFGCPRRWFFEGQTDKCSPITAVFILMPVTLCANYVVARWRRSHTADDTIMLTAEGVITDESLKFVSNLDKFDLYSQGLEIFTLLLYNLLFFRYLLMYFPDLAFLQDTVWKVVRPLLHLLLYMVAIQLCFLIVFLALFSTYVYEFRNVGAAFISTCRFAMGGFLDWHKYYKLYEYWWTVIMFFAFLFLSLILNKLPIAIMLSHKKEKDLFENYSYHIFWANQRSRTTDPKEFDPSVVGYNFNNKEPMEIKQPPGSWHAIGGT